MELLMRNGRSYRILVWIVVAAIVILPGLTAIGIIVNGGHWGT